MPHVPQRVFAVGARQAHLAHALHVGGHLQARDRDADAGRQGARHDRQRGRVTLVPGSVVFRQRHVGEETPVMFRRKGDRVVFQKIKGEKYKALNGEAGTVQGRFNDGIKWIVQPDGHKQQIAVNESNFVPEDAIDVLDVTNTRYTDWAEEEEQLYLADIRSRFEGIGKLIGGLTNVTSVLEVDANNSEERTKRDALVVEIERQLRIQRNLLKNPKGLALGIPGDTTKYAQLSERTADMQQALDTLNARFAEQTAAARQEEQPQPQDEVYKLAYPKEWQRYCADYGYPETAQFPSSFRLYIQRKAENDAIIRDMRNTKRRHEQDLDDFDAPLLGKTRVTSSFADRALCLK